MNTDWMSYSILEALGWALVHSLWQLSLIAAVIWGLFQIEAFKSPQRRYLIGLGALLAAFSLFVGTFIHEYRQNIILGGQEIPIPLSIIDNGMSPMETLVLSETLSDKIELALPYMVYFWLIGVLFYFIRHAGNYAALQQLKARATENLPQNIIKSAQKIKQQLGIRFGVDFKLSAEITVPLAYGILKPVVLIPVGLIVQLSPVQLEAIIAHELAHIRRHDFVINLGQSALEMVFFYHPAFWWINTLVKEAREHIADDMAIQAGIRSIDLANALAIIANQANEQSPELAMAAHSSKFPLLNRIKRMLGQEPARFSYSPLITKTMLLTLMLSAILLIGNASVEQTSEEVWVSTSLESKFDVPQFSRYDTLQKPVQVEAPQVIINEVVEIVAVPVVSEKIRVEVLPNNFIVSDINAAVLDSLPARPVLNLTAAPVADFGQVFNDSLMHRTTTIMGGLGDSIQFFAKNIVLLQGDTSILSQMQTANLQANLKALQLKMVVSQNELEQKMKVWEKEFQPKMEEFERKMEAWQKENEPKLKEFEEKMELWAEANAAKIRALEKEYELKAKEYLEKQQ
ncbi:M56 family metallopeptidase [Cyclobacterium qasimii]|uniref:TonB domain/peptidase M56 domain protein n=2 Tax=Cyclobacterium qasimii TaxID=1350429 RepID=S7WKM5_9BACT|nr:M56 family metallopeptidase [Cyclobacterium qasimii]EPR67259.1 TonB domain/peptidase M56 domain protein [Cyclobacterium qasimii M12-11B]GEO21599.1 hypothetical protein CQA01_21330 [Cyclobacterium qasimii]